MAYQFTQHAIVRCYQRGIALESAKRLFEKAQRVEVKSIQRRFYKLHKYGNMELDIEYYFKSGFVFVCKRVSRDYSKILTIFRQNMKGFIDA